MGCHIHLFTERKVSINNTQIWINVDNWKLNPYYEEESNMKEWKYKVNSVYTNQNYALFSILADVRNNGKNKPISEPKGLPEDVSYSVKEQSIKWNGEGHSHSYFTMKELYDYDEKNNVNKDALLNDFIKKLESHFESTSYRKEDSENYRIVFWFDN